MKRFSVRHYAVAAALAASALGIAACGGYGGTTPSPAEGLATPPDGAVVVNVVGENGALSFSPNPATIPAGQPISWHNVDTTLHHVVLDDGRLDAGNVAPGRYTPAMALPGPGRYHCSIHPDMVGMLVVR